MNRAERRRYAKEIAKGNIKISQEPRSKLIPSKIVSNVTGKEYTDVQAYIDEMTEVTAKQCSEVAANLLYQTETYMGVANIITMLVAVEKAIGNLKTVQKSYQKIINNINDAADYVDKVGVREAYEKLKSDYGINLEFEDVDMNWIDDDGAEVYKRFKMRI